MTRATEAPKQIDDLVERFEARKLTRRELVVALTGSTYNTSRSDTPLVILPLVLNAIP